MKTVDVRNSSNEPCGYLKKVKKNGMVQAPRGIRPRSSWHGRTLSKKDRVVKIFEGRLGVKLVIDFSNYTGLMSLIRKGNAK